MSAQPRHGRSRAWMRQTGRARWASLPSRVHDGQSGQAIVWTAVMLPLFVCVIGLSIDGGLVFNARLDLQHAADAAARAGAAQIDERAYRESAGAAVALDVTRAQRVTAEALAGRGTELAGTVAAGPQLVVVHVTREVPTSFPPAGRYQRRTHRCNGTRRGALRRGTWEQVTWCRQWQDRTCRTRPARARPPGREGRKRGRRTGWWELRCSGW